MGGNQMNDNIRRNRETLKPKWTDLYRTNTAKRQGLEKPEMFLEPDPECKIFKLKEEFESIKQKTLSEVIESRSSLREYAELPLSFEELSYLLWETCRVKSYRNNAVFRTIPTAGATNSMETYIYANNIEGLDKGIYLYVQNKHSLAMANNIDNLSDLVNDSLLGQLRSAPVVFFFTALPERTEYKYDFCAHKMIAMEAGHACQNLSLAAEIIDSGACAICAYDQKKVDKILLINGDTHFATYCATVGKKSNKREN
jgi:SagB-type dehydrogenase family enzyme